MPQTNQQTKTPKVSLGQEAKTEKEKQPLLLFLLENLPSLKKETS